MTPVDVALSVARALEAIGVEYFLGGSMASSFQGQPRLTNDVDFVVRLRSGDVVRLKQALGSEFEVDEQALTEAIQHSSSWNIFHLPTVTRVDLFIAKDSAFDREEFRRRRSWQVRPGQSLFLKSPEDSVLRKLLWFQAGGEVSSQQFRDVVEVLRVQGAALDDAYLVRWANTLGISRLLERAKMASAASSI